MSYISRSSFSSRRVLEFSIQNLGEFFERYSGYLKVNLFDSSGSDVTQYSNVYLSKKEGHHYFPIPETAASSFFRFPRITSAVEFSFLELEYVPKYSSKTIPSEAWGKTIVLDGSIGGYSLYSVSDRKD